MKKLNLFKAFATWLVLSISMFGYGQNFEIIGPANLPYNHPSPYYLVKDNTATLPPSGYSWTVFAEGDQSSYYDDPSWYNVTAVTPDYNTLYNDRVQGLIGQGDISSLAFYDGNDWYYFDGGTHWHYQDCYIQPGAIGIGGATAKNTCYNTNPGTITFSTSPTMVSPPAGVTAFTYKWFKSENGGITWLKTNVTTSYINPGNLTKSAYFICLVENNFDGKWTNKVLVNVYPQFYPAEVSVGGFQETTENLCYNATATVLTDMNEPMGSGNYTYQWQLYNTGTATWTNISGATGNSYYPGNLTTTSTFRRVDKDATCNVSAATNSVSDNVYAPIAGGVIQGNSSICNGTTPSLLTSSTAASGGSGSYTYSWEYSNNGVNWFAISGATGTTYQPGTLTLTTNYRRKVIDNKCGSAYSNTVTVTVRASLTSGAVGDPQTICNATTPSQLHTVTSATGGTGTYSYQWQTSSNNSSWTNIANATSENYQPNTLVSDTYFRRQITDQCGILYTPSVKVTVRAAFSQGTIVSPKYTVCFNTSPGTLSAGTAPSGGTGTYTYQWQSSSNGTDFNNIDGATATTYSPGLMTATTYFRRLVTDACSSGYTPAIKVTVLPQFNQGTVKTDEPTICYGGVPSPIISDVAPSGGTGNYTYEWQFSSNGTDWQAIIGATAETYQSGALVASTYFRRLVTDACSNGYSPSIKITVLPQFNAGTIKTEKPTICNSTTPAPIVTDVASTGGSGVFTYQWQSSADGNTWSDIQNATSETYQPGVLSTTTYYRRKVNNTCSNGVTNAVKITVLAPFVNAEISGDQHSCFAGIPTAIGVSSLATGGVGNYTYQWQNSADGNSWTNILNATSQSYQPGAVTAKTYYRLSVTDACASGYTNKVTVDVYQALQPSTIGNEENLCFGVQPTALNVVSEPVGGTGTYTYQWEISSDGVIFNTIPNATSQSYVPEMLNATRYYRQKVTDQCGQVTSNVVMVHVNDPITNGTIKDNQNVCFGSSPSILLTNTYPTGGTGSFSYQWQQLTGTDWQDIPSATEETYTPGAMTGTTFYRRKETSSGGCGVVFTNSVKITVFEEFKPGVIGSNQSLGYGGTPQELTTIQGASGGGGSYTYQWQKSVDQDTWVNITNATTENWQPVAITQSTYYQRLTSTVSCGSKLTNVVTVSIGTQLAPGTISSSQTVCKKVAPAKLTGTLPSGGTAAYVYQWQSSADGNTWSNIAAGTDKDYQPAGLDQDTYFRRMVSSGVETAFSNVVLISTMANPVNPVVNVLGGYCKGANVLVSVSASDPSLTYTWYSNQGDFLSTGSDFLISPFSQDMKVYVQSRSTNGCVSDKSEVSILLDKVKAGFTFTPSIVEIGGLVEFTNTSQYANSYSWNFYDGDPSTEVNPGHYYNKLVNEETTKYDVTLIAKSQYGCADTLTLKEAITVEPTTGVDNISGESLTVYPNPLSNGQLLNVMAAKTIKTVSIYDLSGRVIAVAGGKGQELVNVDLFNVKPGSYLVRVTLENGSIIVVKLLKE